MTYFKIVCYAEDLSNAHVENSKRTTSLIAFLPYSFPFHLSSLYLGSFLKSTLTVDLTQDDFSKQSRCQLANN